MIKMGRTERAGNPGRAGKLNQSGKKEQTKAVALLKGILGAYLVTLGLLLLLTLFVYRFQLPEKAVSIGICAIYVCAGLTAGFFTGKQAVAKRFLWGLIAGAVYFIVLLVASLVAGHEVADNVARTVLVLFLCTASGMLGGMLS